MKEMDDDYPILRMSDIDPEARKLAVRWVESEVREFNDIREKVKLASDVMSYARRKNKEIMEEVKRAVRLLDSVAHTGAEWTEDDSKLQMAYGILKSLVK